MKRGLDADANTKEIRERARHTTRNCGRGLTVLVKNTNCFAKRAMRDSAARRNGQSEEACK